MTACATTLAATIHVAPADMLAAFARFPWRVKLRMPGLLVRGWLAERRTTQK
jgi:hypothetical protein